VKKEKKGIFFPLGGKKTVFFVRGFFWGKKGENTKKGIKKPKKNLKKKGNFFF